VFFEGFFASLGSDLGLPFVLEYCIGTCYLFFKAKASFFLTAPFYPYSVNYSPNLPPYFHWIFCLLGKVLSLSDEAARYSSWWNHVGLFEWDSFL